MKAKYIMLSFSLGMHISSSRLYIESDSFCLLRNSRFLWFLTTNFKLIYLPKHLFLLPLLSMSILMFFSGTGELYSVYCERLLQIMLQYLSYNSSLYVTWESGIIESHLKTSLHRRMYILSLTCFSSHVCATCIMANRLLYRDLHMCYASVWGAKTSVTGSEW